MFAGNVKYAEYVKSAPKKGQKTFVNFAWSY